MNRLHPTSNPTRDRVKYPRRSREWSATIYSWDILREALKTPRRNLDISIDLLRHGETTANMQNLITGQADVPLTAKGKVQARHIGRHLASQYLYGWSSTLSRSVNTLALAIEYGSIKIGSVYRDPRLNELNFGIMENESHQFIPAYAEGDLDFAPDQGESYRALTQRCLSFLLDVVKFCENRSSRLLISTHQGPMRVLTGIIRQDDSAIEVLSRKFSNTHIERLKINSLWFPRFLNSQNNESLPSPYTTTH